MIRAHRAGMICRQGIACRIHPEAVVEISAWRGARLRPVVKTPDVAPSSDTREAMSGRPGGYVGQAALLRFTRPHGIPPSTGATGKC
jgi:hypothetical protein